MSSEGRRSELHARDSRNAVDIYDDYLRCIEDGEGCVFSSWIELFPHHRRELLAIHETSQAINAATPTNPRPKLVGRAGVRYEVRSIIGRGGMSTVYEAFDRDFDRVVAMKVAGDRTRFDIPGLHRETQLTARLEHPSIVPIYDSGVDALGRTYFTMRMIDGESLSGRLRSAPDSPHALRNAVRILVKVCEAVSFAHHNGVVHRDLKPSNIMVGKFGEVYLVDWGLASQRDRLRSANAAETDGDILGTPGYVSPEVLDGNRTPTAATDIYGLGSILYQALTGRPPHVDDGSDTATEVLERARAELPAAIRPQNRQAPTALIAICDRAMSRDPRDRYANVDELSADLTAWGSDEPVRAYHPSRLARVGRWLRRNPIAAGLIVGALAALIYGQHAMNAIGHEFARQQAVDSAHLKAQMLDRVQRSYSCYVAARIDKNLMTHDFRNQAGTVPIPSTFLEELTIDITKSQSGIQVAQFSDFPFAFRREEPLDAFQERALVELRTDPNRPVSAIEQRAGREVARFAVARVMTKTCCDCHNSHPESPRVDWVPGDVRGALEVVQDVDMHPEERQATIRGHLFVIGGLMLGIWTLSGLYSVRRRHRAIA